MSRDPFDSDPIQGSSLSIKSYLSKTAIVSQTSPGLADEISLPEDDGFLSRMVRLDVQKGVVPALGEIGDSYLLVDFIDERLPLVKTDSSFFTFTRQFVNSGVAAKIEGVPFDPIDPENFDTWAAAFSSFAEAIKALDIHDERIILHRAWWARHTRRDGIVTKMTADQAAASHRHNVFLNKAYGEVRQHFPACKSIEVSRELIVADAAHKWGADPYHYIPEYNAEFGLQLLEITGLAAPTTKSSSSISKKASSSTRPVPSPNSRLIDEVSFYKGTEYTRSPIIKNYDLDGPYIQHQKEWVAKFRDTGIVFGDDGVPQNIFRWGGPYYYSVTIAHHGLSSLSRYVLEKSPEELKAAVDTVKWLVSNQADDGSWPVQYDHDWYPQRCDVIRAPWTSAMGQGLCISFLTRMASAIDAGAQIGIEKEILLAAARQAMEPYNRPVAEGGVRAMLFERYPFYEEYPTNPHSFVLNGFIYSLLGPYDLLSYTGDAQAKILYDDAIRTLDFAIPLYDLGRGSAYDLTHITSRVFPPNIARPSYHFIHVQLLSVLNLIERGRFAETMERWHLYLRGWGARTN